MANICNNTLEFSGKEKNIAKAYALMHDLQKHNEEKQEGAMPSFSNHKKGCFFDLYVEDNCSIGYWTKWAPNELVVKDIADKCKVNFELQYEELGNGLFGKFFYDYKTKTLEDFCLIDEEMNVVTCDDDGIYYYKGEFIESPEDIYNELLKAKIKAVNNVLDKYDAENIEYIYESILVTKSIGAPLADEICQDLKENNLLASFQKWEEKINNL
jgi:hypothetical protein